MRSLSFLFLLVLPLLPACKTTRTVLAGPQNPEKHVKDEYNPTKEAANLAAGQQAAAMGMAGTQFGGGAGWSERFGASDPYGYNRTDEKGREIPGLNALGDKYFGGGTSTKEMKSFGQTKDFLTKRYGNTHELGQKESFSQHMSSWFGKKKANTEQIASETGQTYRDGARVVANKTSTNNGRASREDGLSSREDGRASHENGRSVGTKDFYPAKKVVEQGLDAPKILTNADKPTADRVTRFVKSHSRDNPATVEEIRQLLGKGQ